MNTITGAVSQVNNYLLLPQGSQGITIAPEAEKMFAETVKKKTEWLACIADCENEDFKRLISTTAQDKKAGQRTSDGL